jgi:hypothetical protein
MSESRARVESLQRALASNGEVCGSCRFGTSENVPVGQTLCRRYPPHMTVAQTLAQPVAGGSSAGGRPSQIGVLHNTQSVVGHFPIMDAATGWCGEFRHKSEALN